MSPKIIKHFAHNDPILYEFINKKVYGQKTLQELEIVIQSWSPYRSYACKILWRSLEIKPY